MATPTPAAEPELRNPVEQFKSLLANERALRARVQGELDLRNCALDATTTHFMIIDVTRPHWAIVYANRAIARDHGFETSEVMGRTPAYLTPRSLNPESFERVSQAIMTGNSI